MSSEMVWTLGYSDSPSAAPQETVDAWVPSDVQLVWQKAKDLPNYNFGKNYLEYKWMEDVYWHYYASFTPEKRSGFEPHLIFSSIDYRYNIIVNNKTLADGEGMFTPVDVDLSEWAGKEVKLEAILYPVPKLKGAPEGREQAAYSVKPPVSYGWDWHPRLVPSGLSGDVELKYLPVTRITGVDFSYELSDDLTRLDMDVRVSSNADAGALSVKLTDKDGRDAFKSMTQVSGCDLVHVAVDNPHLWWCARQGEQYRYTLRVKLFSRGEVIDSYERRIGFRRVKLVMNADDWSTDFVSPETGAENVNVWPQTQARFPATFELNGRRIFAKGSNFVPTQIFYSLMTEEVYREALTAASECNMNILRLWGGGLVNREPFFDICDELGLMIWQEFPLACNAYPDDKHYLEVLNRESVSIIDRLKSHPCVTLWCGGNELFNGWSKTTSQSMALRLLDHNCFEHDPHTPFNMTSPLWGMGHGCYLNLVTPDCEGITAFTEHYRTAYTEFGAPSPAPYDYIKKYCPEAEWDKPEEGTCWVDHHALHAWCDKDTWLRPQEIEAYYGKQESLEKLIECGLELQGESYKGMFEEARRKWPRTSMAINWCFNEPWPCFANNSLIMYPAVKRPAYYVVKQALRDQMLSLRTYKLRRVRGETVKVELWGLNDLPVKLAGAAYKVYLDFGDRQSEVGEGKFDELAPVSSTKLADVAFQIPADAPSRFKVIVKAENDALSSEYLMYCIG